MNEKKESIFSHYKDFRKTFLERFMNPNPTETAMEKLLNLRQEKMRIQKYTIKTTILAYNIDLEDSAIKALIFKELHSRDQDRIILTNSIITEKELQQESIEIYLKRII